MALREGHWISDADLHMMGAIARARAEGRTEDDEIDIMASAVQLAENKKRGLRLIEIVYHPERGCGPRPREEHRGSRA